MEKFEDIINYGYYDQNKVTYNKLCRLLYQDKKDIICYVGAGLSLYCQDWDKLFEEVYNAIPADVKRQSKKKVNWEDLKIEKNSTDYLEIADEIDEMLMNAELETSFNERVQEYLTFQIDNYRDVPKEEWKLPIEPNAVFYLPFLMPGIPSFKAAKGEKKHWGRILTTNLDDSIKIAFSRYDEYIMQLKTIEELKGIVHNEKHYVFYLHGYYAFLESFVLTGKDYKKTYLTNETNNGLLKTYAFNPNAIWIFLGARLDNDAPLGILEECFKIRIDNDIKTNFAFFSEEKEKIVKKSCDVSKNYNANSFFIPEKKFHCYAIVFCHMIREAKGKWWNTFSCDRGDKHDLRTEESEMKDSKLKEFLEDQKVFLDMEHSFDVTLKQKLKNYLYFGKGSKYEWAVCWIDSEDFEFSQEEFSPLTYNLPLGNTIYLIYGIDNEKKEQYIKELGQWCDDNREIFDNGIKVRVIYQPRSEYLINEFDTFIKNIKNEEQECIRAEIIGFIDMLKDPKYHTNNKIFGICEKAVCVLRGKIYELIGKIFDEAKVEKNKIDHAIMQPCNQVKSQETKLAALEIIDEQNHVESQPENNSMDYQEDVEVNQTKTRKLNNIHDFNRE